MLKTNLIPSSIPIVGVMFLSEILLLHKEKQKQDFSPAPQSKVWATFLKFVILILDRNTIVRKVSLSRRNSIGLVGGKLNMWLTWDLRVELSPSTCHVTDEFCVKTSHFQAETYSIFCLSGSNLINLDVGNSIFDV